MSGYGGACKRSSMQGTLQVRAMQVRNEHFRGLAGICYTLVDNYNAFAREKQAQPRHSDRDVRDVWAGLVARVNRIRTVSWSNPATNGQPASQPRGDDNIAKWKYPRPH